MEKRPRAGSGAKDVKSYLGSALRLDRLIEVRIRELDDLAALDGTAEPGAVERIVALREEINREIDEFVGLKEDIRRLIASVSDPDGRIILEKRYLCGQRWDEIMASLHCSPRTVYRLHSKALACVTGVIGDGSEWQLNSAV